MRQFDHNGLLLAIFQGKLFEESVKKKHYSSPMFLSYFQNSKAAKELDIKNPALIDLNRPIFFLRIEEECGQISEGETYDADAMNWLGYIYRYICYTRNCSTKFLFDIVPPLELINHYYVYHTQSEEWVVNRILEIKGLNEDIFDKNKRMKKLLEEKLSNELLNI